MKTFGKIIICIIVVLLAIGVGYLIHTNKENTDNVSNMISNSQDTSKNAIENNTIIENYENTDYIGEEEKQEENIENEETKNNDEEQEEESKELTGKEKAIDIVKKKYAMEGQTVKFDHMEGENYVIKINVGTAVTWYLVDGTTWEAAEY